MNTIAKPSVKMISSSTPIQAHYQIPSNESFIHKSNNKSNKIKSKTPQKKKNSRKSNKLKKKRRKRTWIPAPLDAASGTSVMATSSLSPSTFFFSAPISLQDPIITIAIAISAHAPILSRRREEEKKKDFDLGDLFLEWVFIASESEEMKG